MAIVGKKVILRSEGGENQFPMSVADVIRRVSKDETVEGSLKKTINHVPYSDAEITKMYPDIEDRVTALENMKLPDPFVYNVSEYGFDDTGSVNIGPLLQELCDINLPKIIYFPKGTYLLETDIVVNNNTTIVGDGYETIINYFPTTPDISNRMFQSHPLGSTSTVGGYEMLKDFEIKNCKIVSRTNGVLFHFSHTQGITIRNMLFEALDTNMNEIRLSGAKNVVIKSNRFKRTLTTGTKGTIILATAMYGMGPTDRTTIEDVLVEDNYISGMDSADMSNPLISIVENKITESDRYRNIHIVNNKAPFAGRFFFTALRVNFRGIYISGNEITDSSEDYNSIAITLGDSESANLNITGNTITNNGSNTTISQILLDTYTDVSSCTGVSITDNIILTNLTRAILINNYGPVTPKRLFRDVTIADNNLNAKATLSTPVETVNLLQMNYCYNATLKDNFFSGAARDALNVSVCDKVNIQNNIFEVNNRHQIAVYESTTVQIVDNMISGCRMTGLYINNSWNLGISGNVIQEFARGNSGTPIYAHGIYLGNEVVGADKGYRASIQGNRINGNGNAKPRSFIRVDEFGDAAIVNNIMTWYSSTAPVDGWIHKAVSTVKNYLEMDNYTDLMS